MIIEKLARFYWAYLALGCLVGHSVMSGKVLEMAETYGAHTFIQNVELAGLRETLDGEGKLTKVCHIIYIAIHEKTNLL